MDRPVGRERMGFYDRGCRPRNAFRAAGNADAGFLRRGSKGFELVWLVAGSPRRRHRKVEVVFPNHSSRQLGLRPHLPTGSHRSDTQNGKKVPAVSQFTKSRDCSSSSTV